MTKLVNRAKMTTATTGTGTITLGSAVDGYQTFAAAGVANADVVRYVIEDGDAWEIGLGTYTTSGTTLTRGSIESSTGTALNLTGDAVVFVTAAAADLQELVDFADNFTLPTADGTTGQVLTTNGSGTLTFTSPGASLAGQTDSSSPFETSLGVGAGAVSTGVNNTFIGFEAGNDNTTGTNNVAVGFRARDVGTTGFGNVSVGSNALGALTTGSGNVAVGNNAGASSVANTVSDAVCIGNNADIRNGSIAAVVIGSGAVSSGASSVVIGNSAGNASLNSRTIFIGESAGSNATRGLGIGFRAARYSQADSNVGIGEEALSSTTFTGNSNAAMGLQALRNITSGNGNTGVGQVAGSNITTGSNNALLGNGAQASSATVSNEITLGNSSITRFRVPGAGIDNTSAALSGTTPSVDVGARDTYTLTTSGSTTFTFTGAPSTGQVGTFSLIITAGGTHTLTWPASVDWAGGSAPDAPASGETDVYTFMTVNGGTTFYGFLAGDAMA
jgi:hypothetical protein